MNSSPRAAGRVLVQLVRGYSSGSGSKHYRLVIAGGGSGGCSVAARACRALGAGNVAVIEPAQVISISFPLDLIACGIGYA